jgi:hypothetical protein
MTRLPLPLELTEPVLLAGDLDTLLRADHASDYDPKTQLCSGSNTSSRNNTRSHDKGGLVIDVKLDIQVDDLF